MIRPGPEGATDPLLGVRWPFTTWFATRQAGRPRSMSFTSSWDEVRPPSRSAGPASGLPCGDPRQRLWPAPRRTGRFGRRRHRSNAVPRSRPLVARPGRYGDEPTCAAMTSSQARVSLAVGSRSFRNHLALRSADGRAPGGRRRLPATPASRSSWRPTTAPPVTMALSPICWPAGWSEAIAPPRSLVAGRRPCWRRSRRSPITCTFSCDVSLENHMACGFGACFSCVAPIRQADGSTDLRRVCVEGPIVSADLVDWPRLVH